MNRSIIFSIIIFLAMLFASSVYAENGRGMEPGAGPDMGPGVTGHDDRMERRHEGGSYEHGRGGDRDHHGKRGMHDYCSSYVSAMDELELSDGQTQKLRKKKSHFKKEQIRLKAAMKVAKIDYKDLLSEENVDMKAVKKVVQEITGLMAEQMMNKAKASSQMRKLLNKKQRAELKDLMRKRKQQCGMFGGGHGKRHK